MRSPGRPLRRHVLRHHLLRRPPRRRSVRRQRLLQVHLRRRHLYLRRLEPRPTDHLGRRGDLFQYALRRTTMSMSMNEPIPLLSIFLNHALSRVESSRVDR
mmetsp:Transcript_10825/g.34616  ORF Transcript_10825/g.34616 Transcript_10825/m.34616 type:complete len:101 (-) Transcript_10825:373-675(-)